MKHDHKGKEDMKLLSRDPDTSQTMTITHCSLLCFIFHTVIALLLKRIAFDKCRNVSGHSVIPLKGKITT